MNQEQNSSINKSSSYNTIENSLTSEKKEEYEDFYPTDISNTQISTESFINSINENEDNNPSDNQIYNGNSDIINKSDDGYMSGKNKKIIYFYRYGKNRNKNV